jgi:hypothetical protein
VEKLAALTLSLFLTTATVLADTPKNLDTQTGKPSPTARSKGAAKKEKRQQETSTLKDLKVEGWERPRRRQDAERAGLTVEARLIWDRRRASNCHSSARLYSPLTISASG